MLEILFVLRKGVYLEVKAFFAQIGFHIFRYNIPLEILVTKNITVFLWLHVHVFIVVVHENVENYRVRLIGPLP